MRVSLNEIGPFRHVIRQVLHELLNPAPEVAAQLVDDVGLDVRAVVVCKLGQGHPVQAGCLGNLLKRYAAPLTKLEISNPLL